MVWYLPGMISLECIYYEMTLQDRTDQKHLRSNIDVLEAFRGNMTVAMFGVGERGIKRFGWMNFVLLTIN